MPFSNAVSLPALLHTYGLTHWRLSNVCITHISTPVGQQNEGPKAMRSLMQPYSLFSLLKIPVVYVSYLTSGQLLTSAYLFTTQSFSSWIFCLPFYQYKSAIPSLRKANSEHSPAGSRPQLRLDLLWLEDKQNWASLVSASLLKWFSLDLQDAGGCRSSFLSGCFLPLSLFVSFLLFLKFDVQSCSGCFLL